MAQLVSPLFFNRRLWLCGGLWTSTPISRSLLALRSNSSSLKQKPTHTLLTHTTLRTVLILHVMQNIYWLHNITTCLPGQGVEQPDKDMSLKVQKDVVMKHPASLPCMYALLSYLLNFLWCCTEECLFQFHSSKIGTFLWSSLYMGIYYWKLI